jgi:hypothetical protein
MKVRNPARVAFALSAILVGAVVTDALAADVPKRKPGLWEIKQSMQGMPAGAPTPPPMQQCIDEKTDDLLQQRAQNDMKSACPQNEIKRDGDRVILHSVCKMDKTTITSDGTLTGNFDSAYRGTMKVKYDPPMQGMSEMTMNMEGRWLGPCKADMKPGDVMFNGKKFNPMQMQGQNPNKPAK